jgi:hypothetical protein
VNTFISAVQHVRPLRGGAQSHLLRASDGLLYVTKFQNNPQHIRVLANEMFATNLGLKLDLAMPPVRVIEVSEWLIEHTPELRMQLPGTQMRCQSGKHLASLYVGQNSSGLTFDYLPHELLTNVRNITDFARVLVLDKWTCNCDGRQAVFHRKTRISRGYTATFIDQGYCFSAGEWKYLDYPLRGVYANNRVYESVAGWEAFEPALTRAESMDALSIWQCAADIPEEWYEGDRASLERLAEGLSKRRRNIRELISEFRRSPRTPFPNWRDSHPIAALAIANPDDAAQICWHRIPHSRSAQGGTQCASWKNQGRLLSSSGRRSRARQKSPDIPGGVFST